MDMGIFEGIFTNAVMGCRWAMLKCTVVVQQPWRRFAFSQCSYSS